MHLTISSACPFVILWLLETSTKGKNVLPAICPTLSSLVLIASVSFTLQFLVLLSTIFCQLNWEINPLLCLLQCIFYTFSGQGNAPYYGNEGFYLCTISRFHVTDCYIHLKYIMQEGFFCLLELHLAYFCSG